MVRVACAHDAAAVARPLAHEERSALRTRRSDDRRIPRDEVTCRVLLAPVEDAALLALALEDATAVARTQHAGIFDDRLGRLALRISRARDELAKAAVLDLHRPPACRTCLVDLFLFDLDLREELFSAREILGERRVEITQQRYPIVVLFLDAVETLLHLRGERLIEDVGEELDEHIVDDDADRRGPEAALFELGVVPLNGIDDGRVGARPADAFFFERLHQRRFRVTRRRFSPVLRFEDRTQVHRLTLIDRRQVLLALVFFGRVLVGRLFIDLRVAGELEHGAGRAQAALVRVDFNGRLVVHRRRHLTCDKALPDQPVNAQLRGIEEWLQTLRRALDVGRPDSLVRVLSVSRHLELLAVVELGAERRVDVFARLIHRKGRQTCRVGAHVGDEAGGAFFSNVSPPAKSTLFPYTTLFRLNCRPR